MNQSKKILAALVAIPASVVVAGEVQAAEVVETIEIKNDFIGSTNFTNQQSTKSVSLNLKTDLEAQILYEMANFNSGFTITYTGDDVATYKKTIEDVITGLRSNLNSNKPVKPALSDTVTVLNTTELYGTFNNLRVKATETSTDGVVTSVKLEFSVNYFGTLAELTSAKNHTVDLATSTRDVAKIKAIHDYIVKRTNYVAANHRLTPTNGLSSHGYALWTYTLVKKLLPSSNIRYVYGVANGEYRSWNIVEIDGKWYHLDVASNDTSVRDSSLINYRNFLTYTPNERRIISGTESSIGTISDTAYNYFKTIDNQAHSATHIYYADAENNGKIQRINSNTLAPDTSFNIDITEASTNAGNMVYYKQTSEDTAGTTITVGEYLYFVNNSQGKYLYRYDLLNNKTELLVKEQIESITLAAPILGYITTNNTSGSLSLNRMDELDQEKANKVIAKINEINAIPVESRTTITFKAVVITAREMYIALTEEQRALVTNYSTLQSIERDLASDVSSSTVIDLINALDEMKSDYVSKVRAAKLAYDSTTNKTAIYNYPILSNALAKIKKAEDLKAALNTRVQSLVSNEDAFEKFEDFIVFVENFLKEYDSFLPSIRSGIPGLDDIEHYRTKAEQLRQEAQNFINEVKIVDEKSTDFFTTMEAIIIRQNALVASQKYLIRSEASIVTQKINLYETMKQEVATFKQLVAGIVTSDSGTITITQDLIANAKAAKVFYDTMQLAQKADVSAEFTKLDEIMRRIQSIEENTKLIALEENLKTVTVASMTSLGAIATQYATFDTAFIEVQTTLGNLSKDEVLALLSSQAVANLDLFRSLSVEVPTAETLQSTLANLDDEATAMQISNLRAEYTALPEEFKRFFTEELQKLIAQEQRLQGISNEATVQALISEISGLTEESGLVKVSEVKARYEALPSSLQALVTNKADLLGLWTKLSQDAAAYQKAIDDVIAMIDKLNAGSSIAAIEAAKAAYDGLTPEQQALVTNYGELTDLFALADAKVVETLINNLTDESAPAVIQAAREAYDNLSERALELINTKVLENLEYFEKQLASQVEKAEAEAKPVIDRINRIDLNTYTETQIKSIRIAYMSLSVLAKTFVTEELLQKLVNAENHILYQNTVAKQAKLEAAAFDEHMAKIDRNSTTQEIAAARALYNRLSAEARKHVVTYDKLVRLETMWKDPDYLKLVYTYYPDYIHAIKPGGIEVPKQNYDPLYIPDDSERKDVANFIPTEATWSSYEEMTYQNGRYVTKLTSSQVSNVIDRTMTLKADDIEIVLPVVDLKGTSGTVGVSVGITNNRLNIQFTQGNSAKYFSEYVEVRVPMSALKGNASQMIERVESNNGSAAVFKVEGSNFIIRTKSSGIFRATSSRTSYSDLGQSSEGTAIQELAKRGVTYNTTGRFVQIGKQVTRADAAALIAKALDLSSSTKTKYQDLGSMISASRAQGLLEAGIMSGITANRFGTNTNITKQEAAIIIANVYRYLNQDLSLAYNPLNSNYTDVSNLTFEARQSIAILELFGVADGKGEFNPNQQLTRGQFAELIYKSLRTIDFL